MLKWIRPILWVLFVAVCAFHFWYDGRCFEKQRELQRQGITMEVAYQQAGWLCGQLNLTMFGILLLILVAEAARSWMKKAS